jgi:TP901 family phage tail tape measure protein
VSDYNLGTARGRIEIEYGGDAGVKKAERSLDGVEKKSGSTGQALTKVGNVSGLAGAAIAGGLAVAVNSAANFEKGLSAIQAVSGATAGEMEKVRAKALQIGKDTAFGAGDAAAAMEELSKAGVSTSDILNGAADATVALAAAGEVDLPFAAGIASNAMNQFSLKAKDLPRVADLIAGAANASAIDVKEFGYSLSQVGAVANLAGLSLDDTAIAIAEMGNAGIKGSDAGTSLKSMLGRLQPTTDKTKSLMEELGIVTEDGANKFYDQEGKLKSLRDIQEILGKSLQGMTKQQQQATLETLFGSDAIRAAAILAGEGAKGYDKMSTAINKTKAADVAKVRMDNLKGSVEALKGSAETLGIQLGTVLLPTLRNIVDGANKLVGAFLALSPEQQKLVVYVLASVAAFLLFAAATVKVFTIVKEFAGVMKVLGTAARIGPALGIVKTGLVAVTGAIKAMSLALLANPIALIIVALIALGVALFVLYKKSETFRNIVNGVWAAIKTAIGAVVTWITDTVVPALQTAWTKITGAASAVKNVIVAVFSAIAAVFTGFIGIIKGIWDAYWGTFGGYFKAVFNLILAIATLGLKLLYALFQLQLLGILKVVKFTFNAAKAFISAVMKVIKTIVMTVFNALVGPVTSALNRIKSAVSAYFNLIRNIISTVGNAIKSVLSSIWNAAASITSSIWNRIRSIVGTRINSMLTSIRGIAGRVRSALSNAGSILYNAGRNIIQGLINGVTSKINALTSQLKNITNMIPDFKGPPKKDATLLTDNGKLIMGSLIAGLASQIGPLRALLMGVTQDIPSSFVARAVVSNETAVGKRVASIPTQRSAGAGADVTFNVYNPVEEPTSVTTTRTMTRAAQLGVLG